MWRNADVLDFVGWLRDAQRRGSRPTQRAGFYGLDLYSLHASMQAVLAYLDKVDPEAARPRAHALRAASISSARTSQAYGYAAGLGLGPSCEREVVAQLVELHRQRRRVRRAATAASPPTSTSSPSRTRGWSGTPRSTTGRCSAGRAESWNLRDRHMAETLDELVAFLDRTRPGATRRRLGAQLASGRRPRDRDGRARRAERRPARARAHRRARRCSSASPPTRAP